jgi:hypothetical protein
MFARGSRIALLAAAALLAVIAFLVWHSERSEAPPATATTTYVLEVLTRDGMATAPEGTTITLMRYIGRDERAQIERTGTGPEPCAVTQTDAKGLAEVAVRLTASCPAGSQVQALVDYHDGSAPISANLEPQLKWRDTGLAGMGAVAVVRPVQPRT